MSEKYFCGYQPKLIYVFRINDEQHRDCLKVGDTLIPDTTNIADLQPNSAFLRKEAKERIKEYTCTAAVPYTLLWAETTLSIFKGNPKDFRDYSVHEVLRRSGIPKKTFDNVEGNPNDWYATTNLEIIKSAIQAVKEGRSSLLPQEVVEAPQPIILRAEQAKAVRDTLARFKTHKSMLWYAKMRFGKTLSALQLIKEMGCKRTLILTHRPVVDAGWFEDYTKIFFDTPTMLYGSHQNGESFLHMEEQIEKGKKYIYFASMQDLRGSEYVGGLFDKNKDIYENNWDLLIIDEAHEGTQTQLGQDVITALTKKDTRILHLSGTPFNLLETGEYNQDDVFTWDYVMEQKAKATWAKEHPDEPNPYEGLPTLNIMTYDLGRLMAQFNTDKEDYAFNFREFFRVNDKGRFVHTRDVNNFLNLLSKEDKDSCYPFANKEYREIFRHTFWMLPGVKECKALSELLREHPVFSNFEIVNVAGEGDDLGYDDEQGYKKNNEALEKVKTAIGDNPDETLTITLSCSRLSTGVTVPAWTGVFMLKGEHATQASSYMQTIFRVQSPATINGKIKTNAYVFDFAPDRALTVLATASKARTKAGKTTEEDRKQLGDFLNFCPVIAMEGSEMKPLNVNKMLSQLKRVYVERVVRNGFEDSSLYNDELLQLDNLDLERFEGLSKIIGETKAMKKTKAIDVNKQGLTKEQYEELEDLQAKKKKKKELTPEQLARLEELKRVKDNRDKAIAILRGISIRMPLLLYGADVTDEDTQLTIENFVNLVDDVSWEEFMPKKVTKELFAEFMKYYDADIFLAAAKRIREMARAADSLPIEERIERLADIFSTFRNPDKETVLTPWRVVNMHMGDTIGGHNFYQVGYTEQVDDYMQPRYVGTPATVEVFNSKTRLLEINSKTGLYPLYLTYSVYRTRKAELGSVNTVSEQQDLWDTVLAENIFVICKTKMARRITQRTLCGFRKATVHMHAFDDLLNQIKNKQSEFITKISRGSFWNVNNIQDMKFNAIVGNPPYQENDGSGASDDAANPIYQTFVRIVQKMRPNYISLIMPSKWMIGGKAVLKPFRKEMMEDTHISHMFDYENSGALFNTQHIDGGVCYFLWNKNHSGKTNYAYIMENGNRVDTLRSLSEGGFDIVIRDSRRMQVLKKFANITSFSDIVSARKPFNINTDLFNCPERYPELGLSLEPFQNSVMVYGVKGIKGGAKRIIGYIKRDAVPKNAKWINKYKLLISKAYSTDAITPPELIVSNPGTLCTETFLVIGPFDTPFEQQACLQYTKTDFFKILLFFGRGTMQVSQEVFRFIPVQDFTINSDILWNKPIKDIDKQLYKKYNLSPDEISFIESMIRPME